MTNLIQVDFRKGRLSIDDDPYLKNVAEISCRSGKRRRPRKTAAELKDAWGYVCESCSRQISLESRPAPEKGRQAAGSVTYLPARRLTGLSLF